MELIKISEKEELTKDCKRTHRFLKEVLDTDKKNTKEEIERLVLEYIKSHENLTVDISNEFIKFMDFVKKNV